MTRSVAPETRDRALSQRASPSPVRSQRCLAARSIDERAEHAVVHASLSPFPSSPARKTPGIDA